mmetsp:Transcript_5362/g.13234  ORF Transcript_5362/g.13234 Transcript_5362/m.13234 type:complete len:377 (+) Transcript_5362:158-1288(+)
MSQCLEELMDEADSQSSAQVEAGRSAHASNTEAGHATTLCGCPCGSAPNVDSQMALAALQSFQGVKGGMCAPCHTEATKEPTNADLKHVKECIEHVFTAHKEHVEIRPGVFLDQKEARGYLVSFKFARGLLPSAQLAHNIGVQVADAVRRAEREAQRDAQAAKKRAGRQGATAGPNGERGAAGKAAANLVWARPAHLASLPAKRVQDLQPKMPAALPLPHRPEVDPKVASQSLIDRGQRMEDARALPACARAEDAERAKSSAEMYAEEEALLAELDAERDAAEAEAKADAPHDESLQLRSARSRGYQEGWDACFAAYEPLIQLAREHGCCAGLETRIRRLERALRKAGVDPNDAYNSEIDDSECSESELSAKRAKV